VSHHKTLPLYHIEKQSNFLLCFCATFQMSIPLIDDDYFPCPPLFDFSEDDRLLLCVPEVDCQLPLPTFTSPAAINPSPINPPHLLHTALRNSTPQFFTTDAPLLCAPDSPISPPTSNCNLSTPYSFPVPPHVPPSFTLTAGFTTPHFSEGTHPEPTPFSPASFGPYQHGDYSVPDAHICSPLLIDPVPSDNSVICDEGPWAEVQIGMR
jgi:hypothetical protein